MPPPTGPCPECGFDAQSVSPSDAAVAALSYSRRFRGLLMRPDDDEPDIVHRRPSPGEPSALEHAAAAAAGMEAATDALHRVAAHPGGAVELPAVGRASGGERLSLGVVLQRLTDAGTALAAAIRSVHGDEWRRTGRAGEADVTALDIARHGVHAGVHGLRAAERAIARVR